jgi:hypothetical protein
MMDGLQLQEQLKRVLPYASIVFITGHGDLSVGMHAMREGARWVVGGARAQTKRALGELDVQLFDPPPERFEHLAHFVAQRSQRRFLLHHHGSTFIVGFVPCLSINKSSLSAARCTAFLARDKRFLERD